MKLILYAAIAVFICVGLSSCGEELYGYKKGMEIKYVGSDTISEGKIIEVGDDYIVIRWENGNRSTVTKKQLDGGVMKRIIVID